ncbi:MAG: hypothetical protein AAF862_09320 [Pseudomonadota bacterium]
MTHSRDEDGLDPLVSEHNALSRRMLLAATAGTAGAAAIAAAGCSEAAQSNVEKPAEQAFNSWERTKNFTNGEMDSGTPWVAPKQGNFDLRNAFDANLARLKIINNLVGERTYVPMVLRAISGRSEQPGGVMYGGYALFTWQLQVADPKEFPGVPEGTALQRAQYSCVYVDPQSMQPVKETRNPITGKMMQLNDYIFVENFLWFPNGGVGFVEEPEMANDDPNAVKMPHVRELGDDIMLTGDGIYSNPGKHHPRFTMALWRASLEQIMDSNRPLESAYYSHQGVSKAYEKPWTGHTVDEDVIIGTLASGKKVHSVDDIPDTHKRLILEKYPDRV